MGKTALIETRDLTKTYGDKTAVNGLNLSIRQGEVFGLLGPNGAGKTTTILMLLGMTEPTSGSAQIRGTDCTRNPIKIKKIVGYLPDNVGFYPDLTGRQNLRFTGRLNGLDGESLERKIDQLMNRVGITYAADQKTGTYSKGMKQRLGIADVLMKDPQIIIMDEPTLGIDPEGMRELLALMRDLSRKDGRTLLISSHQLYQIQQVCDRVGIFVEGNLVACGRIEELGRQIQKENHYMLELQVSPCDQKILELLNQLEGVEKLEQTEDSLLIYSSADIRGSITALLGQQGYTILHMHQKGGDLDEIYRLYFEKSEAEQNRRKGEKSDRKASIFRWIERRKNGGL